MLLKMSKIINLCYVGFFLITIKRRGRMEEISEDVSTEKEIFRVQN